MSERSGNRQKHESRNPIQRQLIDRFHRAAIALIDLAAPRSILDLGCGEGFTLRELTRAKIRAQLVGIDASASAIAVAREALGDSVDLRVGDARELAAHGERFDMVMMLEVLEHIEHPEQMLPVLDNLSKRWVLLSVPYEPYFCALNFMRGKNVSRWGNDPEHVNHWSAKSFRRFVESKFHVRESAAVFPWTMVLAERRH